MSARFMSTRLTNSGSSEAMERHYQRLIEAGWGARISKETRTIKGTRPGWDTEETVYYINTPVVKVFDLYNVLQKELIFYMENGQPVIEIYDDWRE